MQEIDRPTGVVIEEERPFSFEEIHDQLAASTYGQSLAGICRYSRYKPDGVEDDEWQNLLGPDINGLEHLKLTLVQVQRFISACADPFPLWVGNVPEEARFSPEDKVILCLAGLEHDWGEAVAGDAPYGRKTPENERLELISQQEIIRELFPESPILRKLLKRAFKVVSMPDSKLGRAFNAIERLGYLETGLEAWQISRQAEDEVQVDLSLRLRWLTADVLSNQVSALMEHARIYPPVLEYLTGRKVLISSAFWGMPDSVFQNYETSEREARKIQFEEVRNLWSEWAQP